MQLRDAKDVVMPGSSMRTTTSGDRGLPNPRRIRMEKRAVVETCGDGEVSSMRSHNILLEQLWYRRGQCVRH